MSVPGRDELINSFSGFAKAFLSQQTRIVLKCLVEFNGATQYKAVKEISRREKMASSTIKYAIRKLRHAHLINYNGKIEFTPLGILLAAALRYKGGENEC